MDDCFAGVAQEFLICITVHKAANVGVPVGDLYVKVGIDKLTKSTKSYTNSENPVFNEYFVFEFYCTLVQLLRYTVTFQLKKYLLCIKNEVLGELFVDLHSVWNQPNHGYFKKWGRLEAPIDGNEGGGDAARFRGYMQIDLAIISQDGPLSTFIVSDETDAQNLTSWKAQTEHDNIEKNMLQHGDSSMEINIRYYIRFYRGYFIKKSNYMIQVSFAGYNGKTPVMKNTTSPVWNHEISFSWTFPSLAQRFLILVFSYEHLQWKCVSEHELSFDALAFKDKPALGPTYLHLYDPVNPLTYVGRLLLQLRSEPLKDEQSSHVLVTRNIPGLDESRYWRDDIYLVEFLPIQGDQVHTTSHQYKLSARLAEHASNNVEGILKVPSGKFRSPISTKYFRREPPFQSCMFRVRMPDNRHKFQSDLSMIEIVRFMKSELDSFRMFQIKFSNQYDNQSVCLRYIMKNILNKVKHDVDKNHFNLDKDTQTTWDINRQIRLLDYFTNMPVQLSNLRKALQSSWQKNLEATIAEVVSGLHRIAGEINALTTELRVQDDWPDLILTISANGKEVGVCKLNAKHYLDMPDRKASKNLCWQVRSFDFKSIDCAHNCANCGCSRAIVIGCLSICVERERKEFMSYIAGDWVSPHPMTWLPNVTYTHFRCNVYVHQAKVHPGAEKRSRCDTHLRALFCDQAAETYTVPNSLSPIWNAVISFKNITVPGSINWYQQNPPIVSLEFFDTDSKLSDDLVGKGHIAVSVITSDRLEDANWQDEGKPPVQKMHRMRHITPPPLRWVAVAKKGIIQAEVLMSAEFIEVVGKPDTNQYSAHPTMVTGIPQVIRPNVLNYVLEIIFVGLRNYKKSGMSAPGKRYIKVTMANLMLRSGLSKQRMGDSINFLMAYAAGVVSLPEQQEYWPGMIATDVVCSGSKGENILGAALIPNSSSFLQRDKTIPCEQYEDYDETSRPSTSVMDVGTDYTETEWEEEYDEYDDDEPRQKSTGLWNRLKIIFGWYTGTLYRSAPNRDVEDYTEFTQMKQLSWWTKFYNSMYSNENTNKYKHRLVILSNELEKQPKFSYLQDWAVPVQLIHGVKLRKNAPPKEDNYCTLKLQIKLTPCKCDDDEAGAGDMLRPLAAALNPRHQNMVRAMGEEVKLVVRIYIVQGLQMRSRDRFSMSDCYVKIFLGTKSVSDRANYVPNQSNPVFGRFFELEATLPTEDLLQIVVYDHDLVRDDVIGETTIDLEDRWRSRHRATVGLANEYSRSGYNIWHDASLPSEILTGLCKQRGIQQPYFYGNVIEVDGTIFSDETVISQDEDLQERLSLTALKHLDTLPSFGYTLVPEHVETRSLYSTESAVSIEQGKLQMWVELHEASMYIPNPIDITPMPPSTYEVRVVIKKIRSVRLDDTNIFNQKMSDFYVRGWCQEPHSMQTTDIHHRAMDGNAEFNWRMIFPIHYSPNEDMMVVRRKGGMHEDIEIKIPPIIYLQVWDYDIISRDDYLASIELNLSNLRLPYDAAHKCKPLTEKRKHVNLFKRKSVSGWFPMAGSSHEETGGQIELQLDICTEAEAANEPAGMGRKPPMALAAPDRSKDSFNPLTSPWKSFRYIFWPKMRKYVIMTAILILMGVGLVMFFANLPQKLLGLPFF